MLACKGGRFEIAYRLIQQDANFRDKDDDDRTVLHYAAMGGNIHLLSFLVRCGCAKDKLKRCCDGGETPISILIAAADREDYDSARGGTTFRECTEYLQKVAIPTEKMTPYIETLPDARRCRRSKKDSLHERGTVYRRKKKKTVRSLEIQSSHWKLNWPRM